MFCNTSYVCSRVKVDFKMAECLMQILALDMMRIACRVRSFGS